MKYSRALFSYSLLLLVNILFLEEGWIFWSIEPARDCQSLKNSRWEMLHNFLSILESALYSARSNPIFPRLLPLDNKSICFFDLYEEIFEKYTGSSFCACKEKCLTGKRGKEPNAWIIDDLLREEERPWGDGWTDGSTRIYKLVITSHGCIQVSLNEIFLLWSSILPLFFFRNSYDIK